MRPSGPGLMLGRLMSTQRATLARKIGPAAATELAAPKTRYALSGHVHIAYQVVGHGPIDLVYVPSWIAHVEAMWEEPAVARFAERLGSFARLILFDRRGTGMSDPVAAGAATLEDRMDDVRAVLDAVGSERAALFGFSEGGPMAALFAATYPHRTSALILYGMQPRALRAPDYPWAPTLAEAMRNQAAVLRGWGDPDEQLFDMWTGVGGVEMLAPSVAHDPRFRSWLARVVRLAASPGAATEIMRAIAETDVREILPTIRVPTLILHRTGDRAVPVEAARWVAGRMPHARYVELAGEDHLPVVGDSDAIVDEVEEFLTGMRHTWEPERSLTTILFTDIVDSTRHAAEFGDRRWRDALAAHDQAVRVELERHRGREVKTMGDSFLATFDGPARAIRCALAIMRAVHPLGLQLRAGLHTGECELVEGDLAGLAVHIAARVLAAAAPGEILASRTVTDLVAGSKIPFRDRGVHELKGVPGEWQLFAIDQGDGHLA